MFPCPYIEDRMLAAQRVFSPLPLNLRKPILTHPDVCAALRNAIEQARKKLPITVDAWVLLPDHLHAIWTLPPDDAAFGNDQIARQPMLRAFD